MFFASLQQLLGLKRNVTTKIELLNAFSSSALIVILKMKISSEL